MLPTQPSGHRGALDRHPGDARAREQPLNGDAARRELLAALVGCTLDERQLFRKQLGRSIGDLDAFGRDVRDFERWPRQRDGLRRIHSRELCT